MSSHAKSSSAPCRTEGFQRKTRQTCCTLTVLSALGVFLSLQPAIAGPLLEEVRPENTCAEHFADKLASCTPFRCTHPNGMAAIFLPPSDEYIRSRPPRERKRMEAAKASTEKKLATMSPGRRTALRERLTAREEIKGFDSQGRCQTESQPNERTLIRCNYDKQMLTRVVDFIKKARNADNIAVQQSIGMANGQWFSDSRVRINGESVANPMAEALNTGTCKTYRKDPDRGWVSIDQLNRMAHVELKLLENGKPATGHVRVVNRETGKVVFDKDVRGKGKRRINLDPGSYDIEVRSDSPDVSPVHFKDIKLKSSGLFRKDIEFHTITGTLKLTLKAQGKPVNMAIYIKDPDTGKWMYLRDPIHGKKPKFYFKGSSIQLPESLTGRYEVYVTPVTGKGFKPSANARYEKFLLTIKNGETVEKVLSLD